MSTDTKRMEAMLKAFVACSMQIDEDTPLTTVRDISVGRIDEENNSIVLDMNNPAPDYEVVEINTSQHFHELYASALIFPDESLEHIREEYDAAINHLKKEHNELPEVVETVEARLAGEEPMDTREHLILLTKTAILIDALVNEAIQEGTPEIIPPVELNWRWGESILLHEGVAEVINGIFEDVEEDIRTTVESLREEEGAEELLILHLWGLYEELN